MSRYHSILSLAIITCLFVGCAHTTQAEPIKQTVRIPIGLPAWINNVTVGDATPCTSTTKQCKTFTGRNNNFAKTVGNDLIHYYPALNNYVVTTTIPTADDGPPATAITDLSAQLQKYKATDGSLTISTSSCKHTNSQVRVSIAFGNYHRVDEFQPLEGGIIQQAILGTLNLKEDNKNYTLDLGPESITLINHFVTTYINHPNPNDHSNVGLYLVFELMPEQISLPTNDDEDTGYSGGCLQVNYNSDAALSIDIEEEPKVIAKN